ncbi:unnamed protein product, partial [Durusdinium trenchii]
VKAGTKLTAFKKMIPKQVVNAGVLTNVEIDQLKIRYGDTEWKKSYSGATLRDLQTANRAELDGMLKHGRKPSGKSDKKSVKKVDSPEVFGFHSQLSFFSDFVGMGGKRKSLGDKSTSISKQSSIEDFAVKSVLYESQE